MTLHHVTCHVTTVTCLFIVKEKEKEKKSQKKRNIKSRKILVSKHTITYKDFYEDHKRTQQEILNIFIHYITSTSLTSNYICYLWLLTKYFKCYDLNCWRRDGIVEETPVHVYYAYLNPTWGYGFNSLVVLCVG